MDQLLFLLGKLWLLTVSPQTGLAPLFFPENREISKKNREAIKHETGQSLRGIRHLDKFLSKQITGRNREKQEDLFGNNRCS